MGRCSWGLPGLQAWRQPQASRQAGQLTEPWFLMGVVPPAATQSVTVGGQPWDSLLREAGGLTSSTWSASLAWAGSMPRCRCENSAKLRSVNWLGAAHQLAFGLLWLVSTMSRRLDLNRWNRRSCCRGRWWVGGQWRGQRTG